ncbi:MAG: permease [Thermodesulfobacteriota bacterium]
MKPLQPLPIHQPDTGDCDCSAPQQNQDKGSRLPLGARLVIGALLLAAWILIYRQLQPISTFLSYEVFGLSRESHLGHSVQFFLYDTPKIFFLLALVIFGVGVLRTYVTPERTRAFLTGKSLFAAHVIAALVGIITPFCSCSAIPLFIGFMTAGIPLGVTFSYLIAAPMINEVALIMLYGLLGWKVAAIYATMGLAIAIVAGIILGRLKLDHHLEEWVLEHRTGIPLVMASKLSWNDRIDAGISEVKDIVGKIWYYIIAGIMVGAFIHGFVPEGALAGVMGKGAWWAVPAAVAMGIPMYSNAAGMIPVVEALLAKGAALGTALAFMMSVIALSLPEILILRKALKPKLLATFVAIVGLGILSVGFLFNIII